MKRLIASLLYAAVGFRLLAANPTFTIDASHSAGTVSPMLYGLMTEEINHSYDGGLYAELIRNRAFGDNSEQPVHWSVVKDGGSDANIGLDSKNPLNDQLKASLRLTVTQATKDHSAGVANAGYWGIPVHPNTRYRSTIFAKTEAGFSGPATVSIVRDDDGSVYATGQISGLSPQWKSFELPLKTGKVSPTARAHFTLTL